MIVSSKLCHLLDQVVRMAIYTADNNGGDPRRILNICGAVVGVEALHARFGDPSAVTLCLCKPVMIICSSNIHPKGLLQNQSRDHKKQNAVVKESHWSILSSLV